MSKKANPAAIGLFVLVAVVIAALALAVLGSGKLFKETRTFVLFFDSSLSGLDVGAPVELRGVRVGSVTRIHLRYDTDHGTVSTPVYVEFLPDSFQMQGERAEGKGMKYHIERGLRAQLQPQSLITGKLKIALVDKPDSEIRLVGADPETEEIPTIPTLSESIAQGLEKLPFIQIVENLDKSMASLAQFAQSGALTNAADRINEMVSEIQTLATTVNRELPNVLESTRKNADQFLEVQKDINGILEEIKLVLADRSPERQQYLSTMRSIEDASTALRDLLAYLQLHPEALITGKKEN